MKAALFFVIVLVSGFSAGTIHGLANFVTTEPFLDEAIGIENQNLFASGEEKDTPVFWAEYNAYRVWQKGGQVLAGGILGLSIGSLFGVVFAYSRHVLPGQNHVKKSLVLAGLMWFTTFIIPFLKYPANPPTVGDPDTVVLRSVLYLSFIALSGFGAVGFYRVYKKLQDRKKIFAFIGFAVYISIVFVLMPPNPDEITAPMELVNGFRMMSVAAVTVFWIANALILGLLWEKFQPHKPLVKKM
ncbi:MAG: predicted cobalt transporter CbtA [Marine Group I thaumarchaeote]|nr:MAG: predicted cobalt transporter CbtA [Marine Group I thaumarchaeote]